MVKVKISEVLERQQKIKQQTSDFQDDLKSVSNKMMQTAQTEGFEGNAQQAMQSYTEDVHGQKNQQLQENLSRLNQAFSDLVSDFKSDVDNSDSAELDSEHLSDLSKMIKSVEKINQKTLADLNKEVQMASGAGAAVATFNSVAAKDLNALGKKVTKTNEQLKTFNGKKLSTTLQDIKTVDKNIKDILDAAGGAEKDNKGLAYFKLSQSKIAQKEIEDSPEFKFVNSLLKDVQGFVGKDAYKRIEQLSKSNPKKALQELLESKDLMQAIRGNKFASKTMNLLSASFMLAGYTLPKELSKYASQASKYANKLAKYMGKLDKLASPIRSVVDYGVGKVKDWKGFKSPKWGELGKFGKGVVKTGSKASKFLDKNGVGLAIDGFTNIAFDYASQKGKKHDLGRAVSDGAVDTITGIGPVSGAVTGAEIGGIFGPGGAAIGAIGGAAVGGFMSLKKFSDPKFGDHLKKNAHNVEKNISNTLGHLF
ncbi:T7SS effector LXG polymorphic toxin [Bombilactobacillus thymidiniphilus]|uniref:T7SS effector LXG polymorphic toxin n=1 Tax=Bombilactobacillus thymidiniphilus TaxID=2923363 RepID=A0ABY4PES7_9LACO|nr:T7SS effector LXG polymorphic toxin [Bombilactobacillus thymidiniphilus]UQS84304.1 T7SS effector LXG polymorphic toxin [Bombilactobacillus thymidiniphilus]